jgi:hypothetical protein
MKGTFVSLQCWAMNLWKASAKLLPLANLAWQSGLPYESTYYVCVYINSVCQAWTAKWKRPEHSW